MVNYIHDDYWSAQWQLEAEAEEYEIEKQRIELQNAAGVDMPHLGVFCAYFDFKDCNLETTVEVPF